MSQIKKAANPVRQGVTSRERPATIRMVIECFAQPLTFNQASYRECAVDG